MKDKKILLYAGTTEGRKLASYLGRRGVRLHVCVATAYGESLLPEEKNITVTHDRMDSGQMGEFMRVFEPDYVIDATHPYAKEVTKNLKSACEVMQVPYLRLVRGSEETKESICVENMDEAIKYLKNRRKYSGNNRKQGAGILYKTDGLAGYMRVFCLLARWQLIVKNLDSPDVISSVCRDRFLRK